jgi:hypothetical protein
MGDQRDMCSCACASADPLCHVGETVLARHRCVLHGPGQLAGVGRALGAAAVGDSRGADCRPAQLLQQRPVFRAASRFPRRGCAQCRRTKLRHTRLLGGHRHLLHSRRDPYRTNRVRHVPDPAVHHSVARVADPSGDRGLVVRSRLLSRPVRRARRGQPRPTHPAGHRHVHHGRGYRSQRPHVLLAEHAVVRGDQFGGFGGVVRDHLVAAFGHPDRVWRRHTQGAVLDRDRLRADCLGDRLPDRPSAHPAQLPQ